MEMTKDKFYDLAGRMKQKDVQALCEKEELTVIFQIIDLKGSKDTATVVGDPSGVVVGCLNVLRSMFRNYPPDGGIALEIKKMVDAVYKNVEKGADEDEAVRELDDLVSTFSEMEGAGTE